MILWVIYVAGIGVFLLAHIAQGLSSAMDLTSRATHSPVWMLVNLFFVFPFMCVSGVFGLVRMRQPFGIIEIHADGLLLPCYTVGPISLTGSGEWYPWGFADWSNLAPAGTFRFTGMKCVGLRFSDLEAYLASRQKLTREDLVRRTRLGPLWGRISMSLMVVSPMRKVQEMMWTVVGITKPKSTTEKDVLTWNQENYGFHIIVPGRDIPCGAQNLVDMIEKRRQTATGVKATVENVIRDCNPQDKMLRDPEARLHEIDDLLQKGLITTDEYHRKREEFFPVFRVLSGCPGCLAPRFGGIGWLASGRATRRYYQ